MKIPFDQYQRYKNTEIIVQTIRNNGQTFSLLEVGANSHKNLEKFLPDDKVTYLDIELPEEFNNDPSYLLGDATNLKDIRDGSYDIVVALDVLEHIPFEKRTAFFTELYRVSKTLVIICAPFQSAQIVEAEIRLNQFHKSLFNVDFIWLKEHFENQLPDLAQTLQVLNSENIETYHFPHGDISLWERIMRLHLMVVGNVALSDYRFLIDDYYNSHIFENDYVQNAYRQFVLCIKETNIKDVLSNTFITEPNINPSIIKKFKDLERSLKALYTASTLNLANISNSKIFELENLTTNLFNRLGLTPEEFNRITHELTERNATLIATKEQLSQTNEQLNQAQSKIEQLRSFLALNRIDPFTGFPLYDLSLSRLITKLARKCLPSWLKKAIRNIWLKINK